MSIPAFPAFGECCPCNVEIRQACAFITSNGFRDVNSLDTDPKWSTAIRIEGFQIEDFPECSRTYTSWYDSVHATITGTTTYQPDKATYDAALAARLAFYLTIGPFIVDEDTPTRGSSHYLLENIGNGHTGDSLRDFFSSEVTTPYSPLAAAADLRDAKAWLDATAWGTIPNGWTRFYEGREILNSIEFTPGTEPDLVWHDIGLVSTVNGDAASALDLCGPIPGIGGMSMVNGPGAFRNFSYARYAGILVRTKVTLEGGFCVAQFDRLSLDCAPRAFNPVPSCAPGTEIVAEPATVGVRIAAIKNPGLYSCCRATL